MDGIVSGFLRGQLETIFSSGKIKYLITEVLQKFGWE
jgi:hypothetical protein